MTTICMPLILIAGTHGMNFQHVPELKGERGYPLVLGVMVEAAIAMLGFFMQKERRISDSSAK